MSTFEDLEREVRRLGRRVRQLEGNPEAENEAVVAELTQDGEENGERSAGRATGGGWAKVAAEACEKARLSGARTREILRAKTGRDNG
jgi:hypothetical protein